MDRKIRRAIDGQRMAENALKFTTVDWDTHTRPMTRFVSCLSYAFLVSVSVRRLRRTLNALQYPLFRGRVFLLLLLIDVHRFDSVAVVVVFIVSSGRWRWVRGRGLLCPPRFQLCNRQTDRQTERSHWKKNQKTRDDTFLRLKTKPISKDLNRIKQKQNKTTTTTTKKKKKKKVLSFYYR